MNKSNSPATSFLVVPAIILVSFIVSGCCFFASEVRYTKNTQHYTVAPDAGAEVYTTSAHSGTTYTVCPNDSLTDHYILKQGSYEITQPPPSPSDMAGTTGQAMSSNGDPQGSEGDNQPENMQIILEASNILFDFDKYSIKKEYYNELNRWAAYFQDNPQVTAEIQGHTDSIGTDAYNQKLSERRAQAVINYLAGKGIDSARFVSRGFGEKIPVAPNSTPAGRQKNRRVDLDF